VSKAQLSLPDEAHRFSSLRHVAQLAREFPFQGVEQTEMPDLDNVGDLAGQILADPRQLRQIASRLQ
jgi:hypothetical protein